MSKIIGIDLGTTFSAIAELDDLGNPEVLSDPESGNRITRSVVYFGKDKVIVGEKAKDAANEKLSQQIEQEVLFEYITGSRVLASSPCHQNRKASGQALFSAREVCRCRQGQARGLSAREGLPACQRALPAACFPETIATEPLLKHPAP